MGMKPQTFLFVTSWIMVMALFSVFAIFAKEPPKLMPFYIGFFLFFTLVGFSLSYEGIKK